FLFFLNQDVHGDFTRLATMQDQFTMDAGHSFSYRLDELKLGEGKLLATKQSISKNQPDLGRKDLLVKDETRVWKGDQQVKLAALTVGDELLFNITGKTADSPGWCSDIWIGTETHKLATEQQRKKFVEFTRKRGVPGWVDKTEGNQLTVTLFSGDAPNFKKNFMDDFVIGKEIAVVVANDELRTWNPPVDKEKSTLLEIRKTSVDAYGTSGVQLVFSVSNMLEGFRRGRVVRVFGSGWPIKDQFYGESLMGYGYARLQTEELTECVPKEYPAQFPFRTDHGNEHLPWYQLKTAGMPPRFSEHLVFGELVKADAATRTGQFRTERTVEMVDFTVIPEGSVKYLNAESSLADLPPGTRCRFSLYQDERGRFNRASLVSDEFSFLAANALSYRIEALQLAEGKLHVARQIPEVKNYNGDLEKPPDIGRTELLVSSDTRVWRGEEQVKLSDLAVGDDLVVNLTAELPGARSRCTDIWIGTETHQRVAAQQAKKLAPPRK
ncbi:MAG: hypothetical protein WCF18_21095, partial [Chthoniobacteraceae bacterium]